MLHRSFLRSAAIAAIAAAGLAAGAGSAWASDIATAVQNPIVSPVQAGPSTNVTVSARVICTGNPGMNAHSGCNATNDPVTAGAGSVTFYAYEPTSTTSCNSSGATLINLGTDNTPSDPFQVSFTPAGTGLVTGKVYFLRVVYSGDTGPTHGTDGSSLDTGCAALATTLVVQSTLVQKEFVSGPWDDADQEIYNPKPDPNTNDHGIIGIGLTVPQYFTYKITIDNDEGVPLVVSDVVGADFDLDGAPVSNSGNCVVRTSQPPNDNAPKQPEFIDIDVATGAECMVTVKVVTVANPGGGNELFEPTGTRVVGEKTGGGDIHDTYTLNEGVKVFNANTGERIVGPVGSLQLTPIFEAP